MGKDVIAERAGSKTCPYDLFGGISGLLNGAAGDGTFLEQLFKHTFSQGWLEGIQGGNVIHGFMMGAVSSSGGHLIHNNLNSLGKVGEISANAVLSGTVSEIGGGKFANGAITGAFSIMFNDMMHSLQQKAQVKKLLREFPEFKVLWENYPRDINGKHAHPSSDPYNNQCAIRLAYALKKSGINFSNYDMGPVTSEGYPRGAKSLADWIWREFGKPTKFYNDTYDFIKNNSKTGIFFLDGPNGFADHIDIWNGKKSGSGIYKSIKVWFWEIK